MRSGFCPKCRTPTVYRKRNGISQGTTRVHVFTGKWITAASPVDCYICTRCGYFEQYVVDPQKMSEVTNDWEKVVRPAQEGPTEES